MDFKKIQERNRRNRERMQQERLRDNEKVKRNYRIKSSGPIRKDPDGVIRASRGQVLSLVRYCHVVMKTINHTPVMYRYDANTGNYEYWYERKWYKASKYTFELDKAISLWYADNIYQWDSALGMYDKLMKESCDD